MDKPKCCWECEHLISYNPEEDKCAFDGHIFKDLFCLSTMRDKECPLDKKMIIELPNWARIGATVLVKDTNMIRGDSPDDWYTEKIIAYGYNGVFHQAKNCPMYFTKFEQYGKTIKLKEE